MSYSNQNLEAVDSFMDGASVSLHCVSAEGIIIWANKTELDVLGYEQSEYFEHPISQFHADADVIEDILRRLTAFETIINYPARLMAKNGDIKYVLISSNVYQKDGQFIHTRCFTQLVSLDQYETLKVISQYTRDKVGCSYGTL